MQGHMKGHNLEEFGSGASEPRGTCRAHEGAHPGGIWSPRNQGHMQGHVKGRILEESGCPPPVGFLSGGSSSFNVINVIKRAYRGAISPGSVGARRGT